VADLPSPGTRGRAPLFVRRINRPLRTRLRPCVTAAICAFLLACGGSDGTAPSNPEPSTPNLSHLALFPDRWAAAVGDHLTLEVSAQNLAGADTSGVTPTYAVSNASVVRVDAGDHIGEHSSNFTMSDIAVSIGGKEDGTLISYFETMTDDVFAEYQARGVASREAAIITAEERDADPVPCEAELQFTVHGTLPDWLDLS